MRAITLTLAAFAALPLAACGGQQTESKLSETTLEQQQYNAQHSAQARLALTERKLGLTSEVSEETYREQGW